MNQRVISRSSKGSFVLLGALALASLPGCGSSKPPSEDASGHASDLPTVKTSAALRLSDSASIADVVEAVLPSVVSVTSTRTARAPAGPAQWFFGGGAPERQKQQGLGSGVILSADGIIVTNHHVVEGAEEVSVRTFDDREYEAKIVGTDPKTDIAVLQLVGPVRELKPVAVGDSSSLRLGEVVLAIGNPFGVGQTVTMGIVSAQGRADMGIVDYEDFIQTDAAINPGNSGGALVNTRGELVGINTAILSKSGGSMGIGFAIPTNMAGPIVDALRTAGRVQRGYLAVSLQELTTDLSAALGLDSDSGVLIADVQKDGPGDRAGLRGGDVVLEVNGRPVHSTGQLRNSIAGAGAKKSVRLTILRDGKKQTVDATLGELPSDERAAEPKMPAATEADSDVGGLKLQSLTPELRSRLRLPDELTGVVVARVEPGSAAAEAKFRVGDVILEVNRKPVRTPVEVAKVYELSKGSKLLLVYRQGARVYVAVK